MALTPQFLRNSLLGYLIFRSWLSPGGFRHLTPFPARANMYGTNEVRRATLGLSVPIYTGLEHALIYSLQPKFVARK